MGASTTIEWTDATWNPVTGCDKIGPGCDHCYAERIAERFRGKAGNYYENGFDITLRPLKLNDPLNWSRPRMIFVNSMSDMFHKDIPQPYIDKVFDVMCRADHHIFQVLTKRSSLMRDYINRLDYKLPPHIWLGVSVEDQDRSSRIDHLRQTKAQTRFISFEPLLGPVSADLTDIHWAIVGGESGPGCRPIKSEWIEDIQKSCAKSNTAFFFKQWGGLKAKENGRLLNGETFSQMPPYLSEWSNK